MKRLIEIFILVCFIIGMIPASSSAQMTGDLRDVEQILGVTGRMQEGPGKNFSGCFRPVERIWGNIVAINFSKSNRFKLLFRRHVDD
jgi:hypothetical protein